MKTDCSGAILVIQGTDESHDGPLPNKSLANLISCDERLFVQTAGVVIFLIHLLLLFFMDLQNVTLKKIKQMEKEKLAACLRCEFCFCKDLYVPVGT